MFIYLISIDSLSLGTWVTHTWTWVSWCFASLRYCEDKWEVPRKGPGKSGPAPCTCRHFVARTQANISTGDDFAPHRCTSTLLQIWGYDIHAPWVVLCRAYPKSGAGDEFVGQKLVCSDTRLRDCKEVGNVRAIVKTEPTGGTGRSKTAWSHLDASSLCIKHSLTIGGDLQRYKDMCITKTLAFIAFSKKYFIHLGIYYALKKCYQSLKRQ